MPLSGIRVVDLTRILAGPYATMILGDLGADVIKIEHPDGGDDSRGWGPPWVPQAGGSSAYYAAVNRNKRSVALDLKSAAGREIVWRLIERSDVVVSNFRPGVIERRGFSWEAVQARAPRVVYAIVNGYGATGPGAKKPSFDVIVQGGVAGDEPADLPGRHPHPDVHQVQPRQLPVHLRDVLLDVGPFLHRDGAGAPQRVLGGAAAE